MKSYFLISDDERRVIEKMRDDELRKQQEELRKQQEEYSVLFPLTVEDALDVIPDVVKNVYAKNGIHFLSATFRDIDSDPADWQLFIQTDYEEDSEFPEFDYLSRIYFYLFLPNDDSGDHLTPLPLEDINSWVYEANECYDAFQMDCHLRDKCDDYKGKTLSEAYEYYVKAKVAYDKAKDILLRLVSDLKQAAALNEVTL